jgi:cysteine desulfurase
MSNFGDGFVKMNRRVYLDYAATTPVDAAVLECMLPFFKENFGNPSSTHYYGQQAEAGVEQAREILAKSLNAQPREIVFTACGTESDNLALRGAAMKRGQQGCRHILISATEHHAVLRTAEQLGRDYGFALDIIPVDSDGRVDPDSVRARIRPDTALVSVIYANNEIGTINPIAEIGAICRQAGVWFHTDAVQAAAHLDIDVAADNIDLLSIGAHKLYGPKGVGALYVRQGVDLLPSQTGGGQENDLRAGTYNVPYIAGFGKAVQLAVENRSARNQHARALRDRIIHQVVNSIPEARLTGHIQNRLPNHASFTFSNLDGNRLVMMLDMAGFACSSGSACKVGAAKPSDVLMALGLTSEWLMGSLRVTVGKETSEEEVDAFLNVLPGVIEKTRRLG